MDDLCINCWNDGCKSRSDEFRNDKLPICKDMIEHPEHWDDNRISETSGLPRLSEREKKEPRLVIEENGWQYHFSYGHLLEVFP